MKPDYSKIKPCSTLADLFSLEGKRGLIVGGAGKMGSEFAKTVLHAGAEVWIADRTLEGLHQTDELVRQDCGRPLYTSVCDVTQAEHVAGLFSEIEKKWETLDFCVYSVMAKPDGYYAPFEEYRKEVWSEVLEGNLTGAFLTAQGAFRLMKKKKSGSLVLTSSTYGMVGADLKLYQECSPQKNIYGGSHSLTLPAAYTASKGGILALSRHLAVLGGEDNIRVNVLTPGGVYDGQEESFHYAYTERTPIGRMAVWSDYNGAVVFLVSEASRYMTGANLVVDGGWTAW